MANGAVAKVRNIRQKGVLRLISPSSSCNALLNIVN